MTIGRFYERLTVPVLENLFSQFIHVLSEADSVTMDEVYIFPNPTDTRTLIPFLQHMDSLHE